MFSYEPKIEERDYLSNYWLVREIEVLCLNEG